MGMADETPMSGELIGVSEAADILHRPRRTVLHQANTGTIPIVGRIGTGKRRRIVFRREDIEALALSEE